MRKLLKYFAPQRGFAIFTLLLAAFNSVLTLAFPLLMANLINNGISNGDLDAIRSVGEALFLVCLVAAGVNVANSYCSSRVSTGFASALRSEVFNKVESFSQSDIDKIGVPSLITRTTNDIRQIQDLIFMSLKSIITVPIMLIGGIIMAVIMDPGLSVILVVVIPVIALIAILIARKVVPMFSSIQKKVDRLNLITREKLNGTRVIRAFNRSTYEDRKFKNANDDLTDTTLRVTRIFASLIPIATLLVFVLIIVLVVIGFFQINRLTDPTAINNTIGDLQAFVVYLVFIVVAVSEAAALFIMIPRAQISARRINEVLDLLSDIPVAENGKKCHSFGTLEFRNVSFDYPAPDGECKRLLENISFTSHSGEITAIIGSTGSGKSTVVNLIPRFYDVTEGAVLIDGVDVRELDLTTLYSKLGFIPQQAFLFSGTIADNLRYGKESASDEELWEALEIAQAKNFVEELPDGLNSMISQGGRNLSGGQRQRLCIARAIVKHAELYVFDDSFSALDFMTDARLRKALSEKLSDADILIVAQRVGTIIDADRIIVLEDGRVAGIGKHRELLSDCEVYREIVTSQLSEEEVNA